MARAAATWNQESGASYGFPTWVQGPNDLDHLLLISQAIGSGTAGDRTTTHMGCTPCIRDLTCMPWHQPLLSILQFSHNCGLFSQNWIQHGSQYPRMPILFTVYTLQVNANHMVPHLFVLKSFLISFNSTYLPSSLLKILFHKCYIFHQREESRKF